MELVGNESESWEAVVMTKHCARHCGIATLVVMWGIDQQHTEATARFGILLGSHQIASYQRKRGWTERKQMLTINDNLNIVIKFA